MPAPNDGYVYFAKCLAMDGHDLKVVKIGCAQNPQKRVKEVRVNQPFTCEFVASMPGGTFMEHFVHMWLRDERITGEFFHTRGETERIMEYVERHGKHPWPIRLAAGEGWFRTLDVVQFMERHGITMGDVKKSAGITCHGYDALLKKERSSNRRFLAALCVTAIRRGIRIKWPHDFRPSTLPREQEQAA